MCVHCAAQTLEAHETNAHKTHASSATTNKRVLVARTRFVLRDTAVSVSLQRPVAEPLMQFASAFRRYSGHDRDVLLTQPGRE